MEMNIHLLLKTARMLSKKKQKDLVEAGIVSSIIQISQYETGKVSPTASKVEDILKFYGYHFELVKNRE